MVRPGQNVWVPRQEFEMAGFVEAAGSWIADDVQKFCSVDAARRSASWTRRLSVPCFQEEGSTKSPSFDKRKALVSPEGTGRKERRRPATTGVKRICGGAQDSR